MCASPCCNWLDDTIGAECVKVYKSAQPYFNSQNQMLKKSGYAPVCRHISWENCRVHTIPNRPSNEKLFSFEMPSCLFFKVSVLCWASVKTLHVAKISSRGADLQRGDGSLQLHSHKCFKQFLAVKQKGYVKEAVRMDFINLVQLPCQLLSSGVGKDNQCSTVHCLSCTIFTYGTKSKCLYWRYCIDFRLWEINSHWQGRIQGWGQGGTGH